ncbi:MAG: hypothetical protein AMS20_00045 [Gemmatimonas sp. SG8_28]|nr:MAG: hypothetical protein AMS20_00045 [Gemmatimonas sp. SG8_28]
MPRRWRRVPVPLFFMGEQSDAAPEGYEAGESSRVRNGVLSGRGLVAQQTDWLLADVAENLSAAENHAACGVFPFETQGNLASPGAAVAFSYDKTNTDFFLHHLYEDLSIARTKKAYDYTASLPPQLTGFEMFGRFYWCEYAQDPVTSRVGFSYYDPDSGGSITTPTYDLNTGAGAAAALRFRGISKHRGATVFGWGYYHEDDPDQPHFLRYCKYGEPLTWVADLDETSAGFIIVGSGEVPIIACGMSGPYTIIGKASEIFRLDGDYSSQFYYQPIGDTHGPISTRSMVSLGHAAVWMADVGPAISVQGQKVEELTRDKITRRFLQYLDLSTASGAHDSKNRRVLWSVRRKLDDSGNVIEDPYHTELLAWDYGRNTFIPSSIPAQIWAIGQARGPGIDLPGPVGTLSNIAASNITGITAKITWTPGDTSPDTYFELQYKENGTSTWVPSTPMKTGAATYEYTLTGLEPLTSYDVRVRQVRNGQVDSYVESLDLFTTTDVDVPVQPTGAAVVQIGSVYYKNAWYGKIRATWTPRNAGSDIVMRLYTHDTSTFANAYVQVTGNPAVGRVDDPVLRITGSAQYYWLTEYNPVTDAESTETQCTPFPITPEIAQ